MDELAHAIRLLHVIRAWYWTPGDEVNPARDDILYPNRNGKQELWKEVEILLHHNPYRKPHSAGGGGADQG